MLAPITVRYHVRPARRSMAVARVADLFGLSDDEPPHTVADGLTLDIRPGDLALFTGPSGSGKSTVMREAGKQLNAVDAAALELPDMPLAEALPGTLDERLATLAGCGLGEARLLLRRPCELSDGQRYRFRMAFAAAVAPPGGCLLLDEFGAVLDRTLAKVVAFNLRKLVTRTGVGVLCATTHDDLRSDLNPDVHVQCAGDGVANVVRAGSVSDGVLKTVAHASGSDPKRGRNPISFADELRLAEGSKADWPHFARWHYRSHHLGFVKKVLVLRHGDEPIGICVFSTPAAALTLRSRFFGLSGSGTDVSLAGLNRQLWLLQRVVLHPTYRGAGIGAGFVDAACRRCPVPWIETLSAMGRVNPFFERAGFVKVGVIPRTGKVGMYGKGTKLTAETVAKSEFSEPVYYVRDNR